MSGVDLLVTGIGELATLATGPVPRIGAAASELGRIENAALAVRAGVFAAVGTERQVRRAVRLRAGGEELDAHGGTVVPGFVDAHTHVLYAGDRSGELAQKIGGMTYLEIAEEGGGLFRTVRTTRRAPTSTLVRETVARLRRMALAGTTTAEVKSGYALTHAGELRLLETIPTLARETGLDLVPTYLGAHAVPPERASNPERYVEEIVERTLPEVARRRLAKFADVFCEPGFFTPSQSERILRAALALRLGGKIHADEFVYSGGAALAAHLKLRSAEHLLTAPAEDREALARAGVTAVLLPVTPFASLSPLHSPGRQMVDAGVPVALGTDLSPNSPVESMPLVIAHAVHSARLTPAEAITASTVNAAHAVGAAERAGSISVGRRADFVLFDAPTADRIAYRIGLVPVAVYRQGKRISSR
ncbi:MAG: imidazolonepropionase [Thermoplasmata archaeon]|nr:imidazolonepropionase [Thermoplasmata archaeon]MCI4332182.1 imidazolonepropionase [Thermoplasmata archaeon]